MMDKLLVVWDVCKVLVFPVCLFLLERQISKRDTIREREEAERKQEYLARKHEIEEQQRKNNEMQFLMMERIDNLSDMTHLMAKKLHDAGIINGDLEELEDKYKGLDAKYHESLKRLALEVLNN